MKVAVLDAPLDPWQALADYQDEQPALAGHYGATAVFVGTMRDFNAGDTVTKMTLEHYPGMTKRYLQGLCRQASTRWDLLDTLIMHRVGVLVPNDPIVLVAVWSAHRRAAFEANRYLMEELKSRAPFWKKETLDGTTRWVEENTPG